MNKNICGSCAHHYCDVCKNKESRHFNKERSAIKNKCDVYIEFDSAIYRRNVIKNKNVIL